MRISTPVNKKTLKHHLDYNGWKYILLVLLAVFGWWLIYDVSRPVAPPEKRIDIYVQAETTMDEVMMAFFEPVWKETVPEMEEVTACTLMVSDQYNADMQLVVHFAAADGDIYLMNKEYYPRYARQGMFVPLDDLLADGRLNLDGLDLTLGYVDVPVKFDENHNPIEWEKQLCGVPMDSLYGFMTGMQVDNRELYACIAVNNGNEENVIKFFNAMIQQGRQEKPDWLAEE